MTWLRPGPVTVTWIVMFVEHEPRSVAAVWSRLMR